MIELAQELANCDEKFFDGWVLGRAEIQIKDKYVAPINFQNEVLLCKNRKAVIKVTGCDDNGKLQEFLKVFLILPEHELKTKAPVSEKNTGAVLTSHTFTVQEIDGYTDLSGDKNIIHKNRNPIVPGLCMAWYLQKFLNLDNLHWKVTWLSPVYADDCVNFYRENKMIKAYVGTVNVFVVNILN